MFLLREKMDGTSGFKEKFNAGESKTGILLYDQQGPPKLVVKRLRMTGCLY